MKLGGYHSARRGPYRLLYASTKRCRRFGFTASTTEPTSIGGRKPWRHGKALDVLPAAEARRRHKRSSLGVAPLRDNVDMDTDRDFQAAIRDLRADDSESHSRGLQQLHDLVGPAGASPSVLRAAADVCCAIVRQDVGAYRAADPVLDGVGQVLALLLRKLTDYTCADLRGADISRGQVVDFDGCHLVGVNLTGASLGTASFEKAKLQGARLIAAYASVGAVFAGADLTGAELDGFGAPGANFAHATASGARACGIRLPEAQAGNSVWLGAVLVEADFYEAELGGADFRGANLTCQPHRCAAN